jgi:hypothetical protein
MTRLRGLLAALLVLALLVAACGDDGASTDDASSSGDDDDRSDEPVVSVEEPPVLTVGPPDGDPDEPPDDPDDPEGGDDEKRDLEDVPLTLQNVRRLAGESFLPFGPEPTDEEDPICGGERAGDRVEPEELAEGPAFAPGQDGPIVSSDAWRFADAETASAWVDALQALLADCIGVVQYEAADGTITVEWEPESAFELLGDRTIAYTGSSARGLQLRAHWVVVQVGEIVIDVLHIDPGTRPPDAALTESLTRLAFARASLA